MCEECFGAFKAKFINFKIQHYDALAIYDYDETMKKLIYTFKGCYDYELKDVFLSRYINYLRLQYHDYVMVGAPSSEIDDLKRGFNHVKEMFSCLGLPMFNVIKKISKEKQSSKSSKNRLKINDALVSENISNLNGKKVLIVDDIYTTGATVFKMIELTKEAKPKDIKILVVAKTIDLDKRDLNDKKRIFAKLY